MITPEKRLRKYCKDFKEIENYQEAVTAQEIYHLHHRKEIETLDDGTVVLRSAKELKVLGLYWNRPAEELIFMKHSDHNRMHGYGKKSSVEKRKKISAANKGRLSGDMSPHWKGDLASRQAKQKRIWRQRKREALAKFSHQVRESF